MQYIMYLVHLFVVFTVYYTQYIRLDSFIKTDRCKEGEKKR